MNYDYDVKYTRALCRVCFMRKLLVICSLICSVAFSAQDGVAQNDGFAQGLRNALQNGGYRVITVTRYKKCYSHSNSMILDVSPKALKIDYVQNLFDKIKNVYDNYKSNFYFIVFNEYFFNRKIVEFSDFENYLNHVCALTKTMPKAIFWVNFLHEV